MRLDIEQTWDGQPAAEGERIALTLADVGEGLRITVDAPYHGDAAPKGPPGNTPGLWAHEVVELMLLGDDQRYLEVELGPHGHFLVLELHGEREVVRQGLPLAYDVVREGGRWRGEAQIPKTWLPPGCAKVNAFAIHGHGADRRYLAWRPAGGAKPDFHRLEVFEALVLDPEG